MALYAEIAQMVERLHGKEEVPGSIPGLGSRGRYSSGQRGLTVNQLASPTKVRILPGPPERKLKTN